MPKILNGSANGFGGRKILDVGCGFGAVTLEIAKAFKDVDIVGVDLGRPLLTLARSLAQQAGV